MKQFVITYLGGDQPSSPDVGRRQFAKYQQWISGLGEAVVKPMVPFKNIYTLNSDGSVDKGISVGMTGHTIIQAETIEQAVELTKSCPFLEINGVPEVAEIVQM